MAAAPAVAEGAYVADGGEWQRVSAFECRGAEPVPSAANTTPSSNTSVLVCSKFPRMLTTHSLTYHMFAGGVRSWRWLRRARGRRRHALRRR